MAIEELITQDAIEQAAQDGTARISRLAGRRSGSTRQPACWPPPGDCAGASRATSASATPFHGRPDAGRAWSRAVCPHCSRSGRASSRSWGSRGCSSGSRCRRPPGRGRGELEMALLFTDLVGFSAWALEAGDAATLELLREVGIAVESAVLAHEGRIVKRLGDGLMASFLDAQSAVDAALDAHDALERSRSTVIARGCGPACTGDARAGSAATTSASTSTSPRGSGTRPRPIRCWSPTPRWSVSTLAGSRLGRRKRLRADGAPRELQVAAVSPVRSRSKRRPEPGSCPCRFSCTGRR